MSAPPATKASLAYLLLIPFAAFLALHPLFNVGCSCGHDFAFHLNSWLDAARQLRNGTLYPAWAISPAWNAGEPRFTFYPPLSWMLGELLALVLPFRSVPATFTFLVLTYAGFSMFAVARRFASPAAAFLAATLYLANPYMLFTALERTAYAELLAAVWLPWLFLAALEDRPRVYRIAWPLALLWLTNAPAAVMGSYTLAVFALIRLTLAFRTRNQPDARQPGATQPALSLSKGFDSETWVSLLRTFLFGGLLGLALPAFYLVPAAYERRFVQITMALIPGFSYTHNFLFAHTGHAAHDYVLGQASRLAVGLLSASALTLLTLFIQRKRQNRTPAQPLVALAIVTLLIAFLLEPLSTPLWAHLPDLAFLQFPWRFLAILTTALGLTLALLSNTFAPLRRPAVAIPVSLVAVVILTFTAGRDYLQGCGPQDPPRAEATLFRSGHGSMPTDEYTPGSADNDILRSDDPGYWLATNPAAFAPHTTPNPNATQPDVDFGPPPPAQTLSQPAPHHLALNLPQPEDLILNLRDYPHWHITITTPDGHVTEPEHLQRDDGLLAVPVPAGPSSVDIHWQPGLDHLAGDVLSFIAANLFLLATSRSRKIVH